MKRLSVLVIFLILLFPLTATSFNDIEGYGGYKWGQKFSEFINMSKLVMGSDKNMSGSVASDAPQTWKGLEFKGKPMYIFNQLRFEGVMGKGYPGRSEWEKWCLFLETDLGSPSSGSVETNEMWWIGEYSKVVIKFDPQKNSNELCIISDLEKIPTSLEIPKTETNLEKISEGNPFKTGFNGVEWGAKSYAIGNLKFDFDDPEINVKFYTGKGNLEVKEFGGASLKKDSLVYGFKDSVFCMIMGTAESKDAGTFESLGKYFEGFLGRSDKFSPNKSEIWEKEQYKVSLSRIKDGSIVFWYVNRQYF